MSSSLQGAVSLSPLAVCTEKEESLLKEFLPTDFGKNRTTVGQDQVEVIAQKLQGFLADQKNLKVTKIEVRTLSARVPFYVQQGLKKIIDPKSNQRNSRIASDRAQFVKTLLLGMKNSRPDLKDTAISVESSLAGPQFHPLDLNDRFVTPMTNNYRQRVESFFKENQTLYQDVALKKDVEDLLDESQFPNLYQVKYKPFQGFRLEVTGIKKCAARPSTTAPSVIKQ